MLFPTAGCFLTAAALILLGPVFLEFGRQTGETRQKLQEGTKQIGNGGPRSNNGKAAPLASDKLTR
jgi:hypothetical protein